MLESLRLVRGAVSTKDFIPVLTHFHIYNDRIQGTNGRIAIDAKIDVKGKVTDFTVPADKFLRAVDACDGEPALTITDAGRLSIKKGSFRALLPLADHASFPKQEKTGDRVKFKGDLLSTLKDVRPFVSDDASRPWSMGVLLKKGYVYATNNIILVRCKATVDLPHEVCIPVEAVDEILRINKNPDAIYFSETGLVFEFGDAWVRTGVLQGQWPDVDPLIDSASSGDPVPVGLLSQVELLIPFCADPKFPVIKFVDGRISTAEGEHMAEIEGANLPPGIYRGDVLTRVLAIAERVDFAAYPKAVGFSGHALRGVFVGVRP